MLGEGHWADSRMGADEVEEETAWWVRYLKTVRSARSGGNGAPRA